MIAQGTAKPESLAKREPWIFAKYEEYCMCRQQQFVVFKKPDGPKGDREKLVTSLFTTGFNILPLEGGWHDQRYIDTRLFTAFLKGDQRGALRLMQR